MKIYKSLKDTPTHKKGDFVSEERNFYVWVNEPKTYLPTNDVQDNPEWFVLIDDNWENGDFIYYVNNNCDVCSEIYDINKHYDIGKSIMTFKDKESAVWLKDNIKRLLSDDIIISDNNEIMNILSLIKSGNKEEGIKKLVNLL